MRTILSLALLSLATIGCQTQTWGGTSWEDGTASDDSVWQIRTGLVEANIGVRAGAATVKDAKYSSPVDDFDASTFAVSGFLGYMINDFWEAGVWLESVNESWSSDRFSSEDFDVTGIVYGCRIVHNFSNVSTDVVPFIACSTGFGTVEYDPDFGTKEDADRFVVQPSVGVRIFGWNRLGFNIEVYYRSTSDKGEKSRVREQTSEFGGLFSVSYFF